MLTGLFWDTVDSFAGVFDGFFYMFTGESTIKADRFDNLGSMKILNRTKSFLVLIKNTRFVRDNGTNQTKEGYRGQTPVSKKLLVRQAFYTKEICDPYLETMTGTKAPDKKGCN